MKNYFLLSSQPHVSQTLVELVNMFWIRGQIQLSLLCLWTFSEKEFINHMQEGKVDEGRDRDGLIVRSPLGGSVTVQSYRMVSFSRVKPPQRGSPVSPSYNICKLHDRFAALAHF